LRSFPVDTGVCFVENVWSDALKLWHQFCICNFFWTFDPVNDFILICEQKTKILVFHPSGKDLGKRIKTKRSSIAIVIFEDILFHIIQIICLIAPIDNKIHDILGVSIN